MNSPLESATRLVPNRWLARESTAQGVLCARNLCSALLGSHWVLAVIARSCFEATERSKSLLELSSLFSTAFQNSTPVLFFRYSVQNYRNRCSNKLLCIGQHSKTPPTRCFFVHALRNHCSGVRGSHKALLGYASKTFSHVRCLLRNPF